jgi:hypothetical protein
MESTSVTVRPELIDDFLKAIKSPEDLFRSDVLSQQLLGQRSTLPQPRLPLPRYLRRTLQP